MNFSQIIIFIMPENIQIIATLYNMVIIAIMLCSPKRGKIDASNFFNFGMTYPLFVFTFYTEI